MSPIEKGDKKLLFNILVITLIHFYSTSSGPMNEVMLEIRVFFTSKWKSIKVKRCKNVEETFYKTELIELVVSPSPQEPFYE